GRGSLRCSPPLPRVQGRGESRVRGLQLAYRSRLRYNSLMAILITLQGPEAGRKFPLEGSSTLIGRQLDAAVCLSAKAVTRHHAQSLCRGGAYRVDDRDSSNGTTLNGQRLPPHRPMPLTERDTLQIGPYLFALRPAPTPATTETNLVIREQLNALTMTQSVY